MILQKKSKVLILLSLLFLTSCSTTIEQEIFEDGTSRISIQTQVEDNIDYCSNFERDLKLYDSTCSQNENSITIQGTFYLNQEELNYQKNIFSSTYVYDAQSLYPLINSFINLQNPTTVIEKQDELDVNIIVKVPGSIKEHSFTEEDNAIVFSKSTFDSTRSKKITSKVYHTIPILITAAIISIMAISTIIGIKIYRKPKENPQQIVHPISQEITVEEQKCRNYVLQFKDQYSKNSLYQGLVNSGIPQDRAQYYINKYLN